VVIVNCNAPADTQWLVAILCVVHDERTSRPPVVATVASAQLCHQIKANCPRTNYRLATAQ